MSAPAEVLISTYEGDGGPYVTVPPDDAITLTRENDCA